MYFTLQVKLDLMKSNGCAPLLNILHKNFITKQQSTTMICLKCDRAPKSDPETLRRIQIKRIKYSIQRLHVQTQQKNTRNMSNTFKVNNLYSDLNKQTLEGTFSRTMTNQNHITHKPASTIHQVYIYQNEKLNFYHQIFMRHFKPSIASRPQDHIALYCYGHPKKCHQKIVQRGFFI